MNKPENTYDRRINEFRRDTHGGSNFNFLPIPRIYHPGRDIRKILFGIDIGVAELLVGKGLAVDCVVVSPPRSERPHFS